MPFFYHRNHFLITVFQYLPAAEIGLISDTKKTAANSNSQNRFPSSLKNARDRNRTGTVSLQQDFKSCASASSATRANEIKLFVMGRGGFEPPKQFAADLQSVPFGHSGICPLNQDI